LSSEEELPSKLTVEPVETVLSEPAFATGALLDTVDDVEELFDA